MAENKNDIILKNNIKDVENAENITVDELVAEYQRRSSDSAKKLYLESKIRTVEYMDYEVVQSLCDSIIAGSYLKDGECYIDSCKSYYLYVFTIFNYYTNIEVHSNDFMREFNLLNKEGLIDVILGAISENLMATFDAVFQMKKNDFMTNYYEPHSYVNRIIGKFIPFVSGFFEELGNQLKDVDWNGVSEALQNLQNTEKE